MKRENIFIVIFIIFFSLSAIFYCGYLVKNRNKELTDAVKFRNEYMELNDKMDDETKTVYYNLSISEINPVNYISDSDLMNLFEVGSGLIYFGTPVSSVCRKFTSNLLQVAEDKEEIIYYYDITKIKPKYIIENNQVIKNKEGSELYYNIIEKLDNYLDYLVIVDQDNNRYEVLEKDIQLPTLVMINDGEITGFYSGIEADNLNDEISAIINSKNIKDTCIIENC